MDAALKKTKLDWNPIKIEEIAQHCNDRKLAAKAVSDKSAEMFLALFVKQSGPILVEAHCSSSDGPFYGLCSVQYGHY